MEGEKAILCSLPKMKERTESPSLHRHFSPNKCRKRKPDPSYQHDTGKIEKSRALRPHEFRTGGASSPFIPLNPPLRTLHLESIHLEGEFVLPWEFIFAHKSFNSYKKIQSVRLCRHFLLHMPVGHNNSF